MARTVFSLALLACLGLAILHLVSAQEQNQVLEEKTPNNAVLQVKPEEQKMRLLREADPIKCKGNERKKRNGKCAPKNSSRTTKPCNKKQKRNKNGKCVPKNSSRITKPCKKNQERNKNGKCVSKRRSGTTKKCKKGERRNQNGKCVLKKRTRTTKCNKGEKRNPNGKCVRKQRNKERKGKQGKQEKDGKKKKKDEQNANPSKRQACNTEALCQKIKDYIKYSNQLRKLRRINKTCSTMEKKRDKASAGEFTASGTANDDSDNTTVQAIADKLKNCTSSAKEKCETKVVPACTNTALNAKCETELDAWIKKFGPAKGSCLQASAACCACITAISPDPSTDCLNFEPLDKASKTKKKECTGSGTDGSFGHCRKLQMEAAEKGPTAHKEKCKKPGGDMTTAKSSGRRMMFRNNLMKKFVKT